MTSAAAGLIAVSAAPPAAAQSPGIPAAESALRCYATRSDPAEIVCYRISAKAEFRHGEMVYIPFLVQVPRPSNPPATITVESLDDIRPT
ncbi:hypothetical protein [Streptomyces sp. NPDC002265]|uniref:hypothetical protein n=1 Tax=Streptomyces sp. NPDC002265 TaxID=3154415 RepID=UPI0033229360